MPKVLVAPSVEGVPVTHQQLSPKCATPILARVPTDSICGAFFHQEAAPT